MKIAKQVLFLTVILAFVIQPVIVSYASARPPTPDVGVEYWDYIYQNHGSWVTSTNVATEGGSWFFYHLDIVFRINSIDQTADVYKIRIDYDSCAEILPENLWLYYRWGTSGTWQDGGSIGCVPPRDYKVTIPDATSTTLEIKIYAVAAIFDPVRDQYTFGREPELWMYWY